MNTYEAMVLLDNREVKKGWEAVRDQVAAILEKHGAEVVSARRWDERKLAYEIKKQKRGTYLLAYFRCDPTKLVDLRRDMELAEAVLRHLILKVEEVPEAALAPEPESVAVEAVAAASGHGVAGERAAGEEVAAAGEVASPPESHGGTPEAAPPRVPAPEAAPKESPEEKGEDSHG